MIPVSSSLLQLVRLGIHSDAEMSPTPLDIDWEAVSVLASAQKVKAIALDGYSRLLDAGMVTVVMDNSTVQMDSTKCNVDFVIIFHCTDYDKYTVNVYKDE